MPVLGLLAEATTGSQCCQDKFVDSAYHSVAHARYRLMAKAVNHRTGAAPIL